MTLVPLSWHPAATLLLQSAAAGKQSCALVGPPGVGKTAFIRQLVAEQNVARPDSAMMHLLGKATTASVMVSTVLRWLNAPPSPRLVRKGTTVLMEAAAARFQQLGVTTLVVDEAQNASPEAARHLLWLADRCHDELGHPLTFVLVGTPALHDVLAATGQLGQRIPVAFDVPLLTDAEVEALAMRCGTTLADCLRRVGARQRGQLIGELVGAASGSVRRVVSILDRARAVAAETQSSLDVTALEMAIETQVGAH